MNALGQLVGFFAPHAIWCVSNGGPLVPMVGFQRQDGTKGLVQFVGSNLGRGVSQAREWLGTVTEQATGQRLRDP